MHFAKILRDFYYLNLDINSYMDFTLSNYPSVEITHNQKLLFILKGFHCSIQSLSRIHAFLQFAKSILIIITTYWIAILLHLDC